MKTEEIRLRVDGMNCHSCGFAVQSSLRKLNGVRDVLVNVLEQSVIVECDMDSQTGSSLINAVQEIGFVAQLIETKTEHGTDANELEICKLSVYGMTCQSCEAHLEKTITSRFPVTYAKFDASSQSGVIKYPKEKCNPQEIAKAITDMGFDAFVLHKASQRLTLAVSSAVGSERRVTASYLGRLVRRELPVYEPQRSNEVQDIRY
ncbi:hypothetical protein D918_01237 [Trichuris suis]|nr:hypothetical protein D918_01237 [Trichuris suis]